MISILLSAVAVTRGAGNKNEMQGAVAAATVLALMEAMAEAAAALFPPFSSIVGRLVVDPIMAWSGLPIELVKMTEQRGGFFTLELAQRCSAVNGCQPFT